MSNPPDQTLQPLLKIAFPPGERLGRGKIELLEHIRETGSISAAGRRMDLGLGPAGREKLEGLFRPFAENLENIPDADLHRPVVRRKIALSYKSHILLGPAPEAGRSPLSVVS